MWELTQKFRNIRKHPEPNSLLPTSLDDRPLLRREKISFEKKPFFAVRREIEENGQPGIKTLAERLREQISGRRLQLPNVVLLTAGAVVSLLLVGLILFWVGVITRESELKEMISLFYNHQPSVIYDRDGKKVSEIFDEKNEQPGMGRLPGESEKDRSFGGGQKVFFS